MTDEVSAASTILECNGEAPLENVPAQVVDVIDSLSKPAGVVSSEQEEKCALAEENQETKICKEVCSTHEKGTDEISQETKNGEFSSETDTGPEKTSENANDCEVATKEETQLEKHLEENDNTINELNEMNLQEPETGNGIYPAKTEEDREIDEASENTPTVGSENGNEDESCFYDQESDGEETPPNSPRSGSLPGAPKGQPSLGMKPEISKHNYSKYDTVSYRKIRKGNTKQRIDEFESMMNL